MNTPVIAIVDDDPSVRRALHRLVQSANYTAQAFASAPEFLDSLRHGRAACLVLDIHLNGMSGFDLQERLATDGVGVPVIFVTAHDDARTRARIDTSGAAGHLWKPVDEQALLSAIYRATGGTTVPRTRASSRMASGSGRWPWRGATDSSSACLNVAYMGHFSSDRTIRE